MERDHVMALDFDPTVAGIASQPFWLSWHDDAGKLARMHRTSSLAEQAVLGRSRLPPGGATQAARRGQVRGHRASVRDGRVELSAGWRT
jgi:hypothetical protein